jgi:glycosyltransferase involved in cell wall biosynthesis
MPLIQIFIPTHNRPELVMKAIDSALNQDFSSYEVIVSDNSTGDDSGRLISRINDRRLIYKRRIPVLSSSDHFNSILGEVTSDYFMIFHDDDVMYPDMLQILYNIISSRDAIVAVGANARVLSDGKVIRKEFCKDLKTDKIISGTDEIIRAYSLPRIVPFPGYLYRKTVAQKMRFNPVNGGKHSDVAFIIDLLKLGEIVFAAKPLMDYNLHGMQDSRTYEFSDYQKLIGYISKEYGYPKDHPVIRRLRIQNIYGEFKYQILARNIPVLSGKYRMLGKLLFRYSLNEYFIKIILLTIYRKTGKLFKKP